MEPHIYNGSLNTFLPFLQLSHVKMISLFVSDRGWWYYIGSEIVMIYELSHTVLNSLFS